MGFGKDEQYAPPGQSKNGYGLAPAVFTPTSVVPRKVVIRPRIRQVAYGLACEHGKKSSHGAAQHPRWEDADETIAFIVIFLR